MLREAESPTVLEFREGQRLEPARLASAERGRRCRLGITHFAFGDLFQDEIRDYRERQLAGTEVVPLFPLWGAPADTPGLARTMLAAGQRAILICV
jgi:hypothetical protein